MKSKYMQYAVALFAVASLVVGTQTVTAQPALQLDIVGGTYDPVNEDIVSAADVFQVAAILNPGNGSAPDSDDTFFLTVSLLPTGLSAGNYGSFSVDGNVVNVTADMASGTPSGLSPHGHFANFYEEISFTFDLSDAGKVILYNTQDNPGGPTFNTSGTAFAVLFDIDKSNLSDAVQLHFDLYNKDGEGEVDKNAPFSHDASTVIPEPTGFVLTLAGMGLFGMIRRRR